MLDQLKYLIAFFDTSEMINAMFSSDDFRFSFYIYYYYYSFSFATFFLTYNYWVPDDCNFLVYYVCHF